MSAALSDPLAIVREAVAGQRARKGSAKAAVAVVARAFGLTPRRIHSIVYGQPVRLDYAEADRIRAAARRVWAQEINEAEARAAMLRARLAEIKGAA